MCHWENGRPVVRGTPVEERLRSSLMSQFTRARVSISNVDMSDKRLADDIAAVKRNFNGDVAAATAEILKESVGEVLVFFVELLPGGKAAEVDVVLKVIDTRSGDAIAGAPFLPIPNNATVESLDQYATSILSEFLSAYAEPGRRRDPDDDDDDSLNSRALFSNPQMPRKP